MPRTRKARAQRGQTAARRTVGRAARRTPARRNAPVRKKASARRAAAAPRIPYRNVTPYLAVPDAARAIDWYARAFGAKELMRMDGPGGKILHAELMIGDSRIMLADPFPGMDTKHPQSAGGTTVGLHLYHRNVDRLWQQAVAAGARVVMPLDDQFWGDRYGKLADPFGHSWGLAFKSKLSRAELERKRAEAMASMGAGAQP